MTLVLQRTQEQRAALDHLLQELQDPESPGYHQWLTPEEFGERFGIGSESLVQLTGWLRSKGFTVNSTARGRGWIDFSGTVAQVQNAFHSEIHRFQVGAQTHFAPARSPWIPAEFEHLITGIRGLDDFYMKRSKRLGPLFTASDGTHALAPGDIARIYNLDLAGGGRTIAVVGESAVDPAEIRRFRSTFQLPPNEPQLKLVGDDPGIGSNAAVLEAHADLEWAGATARYSPIVYAYATDVLVAAQEVIDQNLAAILTFSFGVCEANLSKNDARFIQDLAQQANAQGITWVAASGDAGAATCDQGSYPATQGLSVSVPASVPEVTAVGGTEFNESNSAWCGLNLDLSSACGYMPEVSWNDTSPAVGLAASGGGASVLYPKPPWQSGAGVPDDNARDVPDVALTASYIHDPYIVFSGGKNYAAGGTSLSAPVFAGILASVLVGGVGTPSGGLGNINPSLYRTAAFPGATAGAPFHDITAGTNSVPCVDGTRDCLNGSLGYAAGPGYDLVTGLGSVNASYFANILMLSTVTTLSASQTTVAEGTPIALTATVKSYNGAVPAGYLTLQESDGSGPGSPGLVGGYLDAKGTLSITVLLRRGIHSIKGVYSSAKPGIAGSTSAAVTVVVAPAAPQPPPLAAPTDHATDTPFSVRLAWGVVPFATSYDVYFGTSPSPPFWGNVGTELQCQPGAYAAGTKYYWRVTAKNDSGATASPIWTFTTTTLVYTISTIAGSNAAGFTADGLPIAGALLSGPVDVAFDGKGNLYVAEMDNGRVRMINAAGMLSTVAGGGTGPDGGGDGGPATAARLYPRGIAIDSQGNLYISESTPGGRSSIRKVSPPGIITTIAGNMPWGYSGDNGPAVLAQLGSSPSGLAVDSQGALYIADTSNYCIRKIAAGMISTVAGSPLNGGYTLGGSVGDGGPATSANLYASGVTVDASGNLYIADRGNCRIRKVTTDGIINTIAGAAGPNQGCTGQEFRVLPVRLAVDPTGSLYFSDDDGARIVKLTNGLLTTIAGGGVNFPGDGAPGTLAVVAGAAGLTLDSRGRIYFAESLGPVYSYGGQRLRMLSPSTAYTPPPPSIATAGVRNGASSAPAPVAAGSVATIFGSFGFGSGVQAGATPLPPSLSGLSIQLLTGAASINAPLSYASASQINVQIPWEVAGQSQVSIRPVLNGIIGASQVLQLAPFAPGIFTIAAYGSVAAVTDSSNLLVGFANPTAAGSVVQIFCTGLGSVTSPPPSGSPASTTALSRTIATPIVMIGGLPATVLFSGLAPGTVGEYQVNIQIPDGVSPGPAASLVLSINGIASNTVTIPVRGREF